MRQPQISVTIPKEVFDRLLAYKEKHGHPSISFSGSVLLQKAIKDLDRKRNGKDKNHTADHPADPR